MRSWNVEHSYSKGWAEKVGTSLSMHLYAFVGFGMPLRLKNFTFLRGPVEWCSMVTWYML